MFGGLKKLFGKAEAEMEAKLEEKAIAAPAPAERTEADERVEKKIKIGIGARVRTTLGGTARLGESEVGDITWSLQMGLMQSDVALEVAEAISSELKQKLSSAEFKDPKGQVRQIFKDTLVDVLEAGGKLDFLEFVKKHEKPVRIVFFGINGTGKCIDGDSKITLGDGQTITIRKLYERAEETGIKRWESDGFSIEPRERIEVFSLNQKNLKMERKRVSHLWKLRADKVVKVSLSNGFEITTTPEHPFFTIESSGIKKIRADALTEGAYVATPKGIDLERRWYDLTEKLGKRFFVFCNGTTEELYGHLESNYPSLNDAHKALGIDRTFGTFAYCWRNSGIFPLDAYKKLNLGAVKRIKYGKSAPIDVPELDYELGEFLGLLFSEGYMLPGYVDFTNSDGRLIEKFLTLAEYLFGVSARIEYDKRREGLKRVRIFSRTLTAFLNEAFGYPYGRKDDSFGIPTEIINSTEASRGFLCGYIDGDGHVNKNVRVVEIPTSYKTLASDLSTLLLSFGIQPTISRKRTKCKDSYRVYVCGRRKLELLNNVVSCLKSGEMNNLCKMPHQFEKTELVPNIGTSLREVREALGIFQKDIAGKLGCAQSLVSQYESGVQIPRESLSQICDYSVGRAKHQRNAKVLQQLRKLKLIADSGIIWRGVKSLEMVQKDCYVYDLTVPENHNFVANNVIVHNTTTIAKVAHLLKKNGLSVVAAAGDTFRAGAQEQLGKHMERVGIKMVHHQRGGDAAAVVFDAVKHAQASGIDVVLADTSGRMQSDSDLMGEMEKIVRVNKPDLRIFVGDALTGNDAVEQARVFNERIGIDAAILAKCDASKGGAALSISYVTKKPVIFLGMGQGYDDLKPFDARAFVDEIL